VSAASDEAGVGGDDVGGNSQGEQNRAENEECSVHASSVWTYVRQTLKLYQETGPSMV